MTLTNYGNVNSQIELREIDGGNFQIVRVLAPDNVLLLGTVTSVELIHLRGMINAAMDVDSSLHSEAF